MHLKRLLYNYVSYKIKLKQRNFERINAKKIRGFEHFSLQIRDIEKNYQGFVGVTLD